MFRTLDLDGKNTEKLLKANSLMNGRTLLVDTKTPGQMTQFLNLYTDLHQRDRLLELSNLQTSPQHLTSWRKHTYLKRIYLLPQKITRHMRSLLMLKITWT